MVGLYDGRIMPIECKVSNSEVNSVKRVNDTIVAKAVSWRAALDGDRVVPAAVLSGVYRATNLADAQARGVTLFWAHDLRPLLDFVASTK